jgi:hypothetical protein
LRQQLRQRAAALYADEASVAALAAELERLCAPLDAGHVVPGAED